MCVSEVAKSFVHLFLLVVLRFFFLYKQPSGSSIIDTFHVLLSDTLITYHSVSLPIMIHFCLARSNCDTCASGCRFILYMTYFSCLVLRRKTFPFIKLEHHVGAKRIDFWPSKSLPSRHFFSAWLHRLERNHLLSQINSASLVISWHIFPYVGSAQAYIIIDFQHSRDL